MRSIIQIAAMSALLSGPLFAVTTVISDNFDSGTASADWYRNSAVNIVPGGPGASVNYAHLLAGADVVTSGLGDQIGMADNFVIDFYFRVQASSNRQLNLSVSTVSVNPSPGDATVNLRIQGNTFAVYRPSDTTWVAVGGLGSVTPGTWYRMQFEGVGWGSAGASYTLRLSGAGGDTLTNEVTGLTTIQNGSITGNTTYGGNVYNGTARSFLFSTTYGTNPGFDIDNVVVTGNLIPEPSAVAFLGAASLVGLSRRRRA
ncbi:MAG: hypothetical protein KF712_20205 [Akkermansiaceae bacterium]|nr:hypothetical protein [Akkermansiaceae bacterium]